MGRLLPIGPQMTWPWVRQPGNERASQAVCQIASKYGSQYFRSPGGIAGRQSGIMSGSQAVSKNHFPSQPTSMTCRQADCQAARPNVTHLGSRTGSWEVCQAVNQVVMQHVMLGSQAVSGGHAACQAQAVHREPGSMTLSKAVYQVVMQHVRQPEGITKP